MSKMIDPKRTRVVDKKFAECFGPRYVSVTPREAICQGGQKKTKQNR
jgi:hypothetical protein